MERIDINVRYLDETYIAAGKVNIIKSLCGTGKTESVKKFLKALPIETRVLIPTFRRSLCCFLTSLLENVISYLDCKQKRIDCDDFPRICISPESFWRYTDEDGAIKRPNVLLWDEFCSFLEHLVNMATLSGHQRSYFIDVVSLWMKDPSVTVIICDAYFDEEIDLQIVEMMCGGLERIRYVHNHYVEKKIKVYSYHSIGAVEWKRRYFQEVFDPLVNTYVFANSKKVIEGLEREYSEIKTEKDIRKEVVMENEVDTRVLVTGDSTDEEKTLYSSDPDSSWVAKKFMVSPTIQAGVGLNKEIYSRGFGFAIQQSSSVLALCQQMARPRHLVENELHIMFPPDAKLNEDEIDADLNVDRIWADISRYENWTNMRVANLITWEIIQEKDRAWRRPVARHVLNSIIVRCLYNEARQKLSFVNEFKRYTENDWYEFEEVTFPHCIDGPFKYTRNIMHTFECAKNFRTTFWENLVMFNWDGSWPGDEWITINKGGAFEKFIKFSENWNVFGPLGKVSELYEPAFIPTRLALFGTTFVNNTAQSNFHHLITQTNATHVDIDSMENRYNALSYNAIFFSAASLIFGCYGLFQYDILRTETEGEINFFDSTIYQVTGSQLPVHFVMDESRLNNAFVFERLCIELDKSYSLLVQRMRLGLVGNKKPRWLDERLLNQKAISDMRKIMDGLFKFFGLERSKAAQNVERPEVFNFEHLKLLNRTLPKGQKIATRIRVRSYPVNFMLERIMLSLLKMFSKNTLGLMHPNYFVPDPFQLLDYKRVPTHLPELSPLVNSQLFHQQSAIWPKKPIYVDNEYVTQAIYWGEKEKHHMKMTSSRTVLNRFDYWNPMEHGLERINVPLIPFFTDYQIPIKELQRRLPLRKWDEYPFK